MVVDDTHTLVNDTHDTMDCLYKQTELRDSSLPQTRHTSPCRLSHGLTKY